MPNVPIFFALISTKLIVFTFLGKNLFHNYSYQQVKFKFYTDVEILLSVNRAKLSFIFIDKYIAALTNVLEVFGQRAEIFCSLSDRKLKQKISYKSRELLFRRHRKQL